METSKGKLGSSEQFQRSARAPSHSPKLGGDGHSLTRLIAESFYPALLDFVS